MSRPSQVDYDRHRKSGKNQRRMDLRNTFSSISGGNHRDLVKSETVQGTRPTLSLAQTRWQRPSGPDFVNEMRKSMLRWGVQELGRNIHRLFWQRHERYVEQVIREIDLPPQPANDLQRLSDDPWEAMAEVFGQEIRTMASNPLGFLTETDHLSTANSEINSMYSPYRFNKETRHWQLREAFIGCDPDPFRRYTFERVAALIKIEQDMVETEPVGLAMRAIVAHWACAHAKCFKCKQTSIRWNGFNRTASLRYWKRLVCERCQSVYEIVSKSTEDSILKCLERRFYGGNRFDAFHSVKKELPPGAKQFIAAIPINASRITPAQPEEVRCVYVAEVEHVLPDLKPQSFYLEDDICKVYSSIRAKQGWGLWFKAPVFEYDGKSISAEILKDLRREQRRRVARTAHQSG